jgi:hypothetical protein
MEGVKILERSPEELPGVEGSERSARRWRELGRTSPAEAAAESVDSAVL